MLPTRFCSIRRATLIGLLPCPSPWIVPSQDRQSGIRHSSISSKWGRRDSKSSKPPSRGATRQNPSLRPTYPRPTPASSHQSHHPSHRPPPRPSYSLPERKSRTAEMNLGSRNAVIPGLTLLNTIAPKHLPTAAPLTTSNPLSSTPDQKSIQTDAQEAPGGKKRKAPPRKPGESPPQRRRSPSRNHSPKPDRRSPTQSQSGRQSPSKESGGVPDPTPLYLAQALAPPLSVAHPRPILVVMDLNGTLLYRPNKRNPFNFIQRPHAQTFLSYCLETFHVAIWSSARPENVNKMVAQLLTPAQRARLVVIWARDKFGLSPADYDSKVQCYKRLSSLWSAPAVVASHPGARFGQRWDQTNTVLVDDSIEKARTEPHNLLEISEFSGPQNEKAQVLPQVHEYLNQLCFQADVSRFIRQNPFKVKDAHPSVSYRS